MQTTDGNHSEIMEMKVFAILGKAKPDTENTKDLNLVAVDSSSV
jgi:hypothetical protein